MSIYFSGFKAEVGGVNLLTGTETGNGWIIYKNSGSLDDANKINFTSNENEKVKSKTIFHLWTSSFTAKDVALQTIQKLYLPRGYYTFSFIGKHGGYDSDKYRFELYSTYTDIHSGQAHGAVTLTNEWKNYSITFYIDQSQELKNLRLLNFSDTKYPGGSVYIANLQLERGLVASDYRPNYQEQIADLQNQINQLKK